MQLHRNGMEQNREARHTGTVTLCHGNLAIAWAFCDYVTLRDCHRVLRRCGICERFVTRLPAQSNI